MRRVGCLALFVTVLLAGVPAAADNAAILATIEKHLQQADPQPVLKLLTPAVCEALARLPKDAATACAHAVSYARKVTEHTSDPEDIQPVLDAFLKIGGRAVELHPDEIEAHVALARARRAVCRYRLADDGTIVPEEWHAVAATWLAAGELPKGGSRTLDAFLTLLEGAAGGEEHREALLAYAEALGRKLLAEDARHPQAGAGLAEVRFAQARELLSAGDKKEAEAAARDALALLADLTGSKSVVFGRARSIVNRVARFLRTSKIDRKAEFLARKVKTRWGYLTFEMPWGNHWSIKHTKSKDVQTMTTLTRTDELDAPGRTFVIFKRYKWSTEYTSDEGDFGGDNPRGLLELDRDSDVEWLTRVTRQRKLIRGKLNRGIRKTSGYEVQGTDADLDAWWIRTWYFKSAERPRTFCVRVSRYGADPGLDPEIQHILDSIREVPEQK